MHLSKKVAQILGKCNDKISSVEDILIFQRTVTFYSVFKDFGDDVQLRATRQKGKEQ